MLTWPILNKLDFRQIFLWVAFKGLEPKSPATAFSPQTFVTYGSTQTQTLQSGDYQMEMMWNDMSSLPKNQRTHGFFQHPDWHLADKGPVSILHLPPTFFIHKNRKISNHSFNINIELELSPSTITYQKLSVRLRDWRSHWLVANLIIIRCVLQLEGSPSRKVFVLRSSRFVFFSCFFPSSIPLPLLPFKYSSPCIPLQDRCFSWGVPGLFFIFPHVFPFKYSVYPA